MKAAIRTRYGGPDHLTIEEVPCPKPGPKESLIKVHFTTVNRTDCGALWGQPYIYRFFVGWPRPKTLSTGTDLAGEVVEVGAEVKDLQPGDRVMAFDDNGKLASHAEYTLIGPSVSYHPIPDDISFEQAAASLEAAHYAVNFLNKLNISKAHKVFLHGATGAIGSAGLQFLKHRGAYVTATSTTKSLDLIRSLGADRVIDWEATDFLKDNERYDFFFDSVGKSAFGRCKHLLTPHGIYMSSELGPRVENPFRAMIAPLQKGKKVKFPLPGDIAGSLRYISARLADGSFRPVIDKTYSLEKIREAYTYVRSGQKTGNVILQCARS